MLLHPERHPWYLVGSFQSTRESRGVVSSRTVGGCPKQGNKNRSKDKSLLHLTGEVEGFLPSRLNPPRHIEHPAKRRAGCSIHLSARQTARRCNCMKSVQANEWCALAVKDGGRILGHKAANAAQPRWARPTGGPLAGLTQGALGRPGTSPC